VVIRAIDAPGQINAVCKELRDRYFNIDKLQLTPTAYEYPRQRTMTLFLSRHDNLDTRKTIELIEVALQYLVGVRAFSIRVIGGG
jgi:acetolactate synthase small subunit